MFCSFLLCMMRWFYPNAAVEIYIGPASPLELISARIFSALVTK